VIVTSNIITSSVTFMTFPSNSSSDNFAHI
jgi:hypothetical protein